MSRSGEECTVALEGGGKGIALCFPLRNRFSRRGRRSIPLECFYPRMAHLRRIESEW